MPDVQKWSAMREVQYFDGDKLTRASAHLLECPHGHPLVFRALAAGSERFAGALECHECPPADDQYPMYDLPFDLR